LGTIVGVFYGALDGVQAPLIRRTKCGYMVELLESKDAVHKGDKVHLSVAEFEMNTNVLDPSISSARGIDRRNVWTPNQRVMCRRLMVGMTWRKRIKVYGESSLG
jgi:hypothetical protein